jgi:hypothetical protein
MKKQLVMIVIKDMFCYMALVKCEMMLGTLLNVLVKTFVNYLVKSLALILRKVNYKCFSYLL